MLGNEQLQLTPLNPSLGSELLTALCGHMAHLHFTTQQILTHTLPVTLQLRTATKIMWIPKKLGDFNTDDVHIN